MIARPKWHISRPDLEILVNSLEVRVLKLAECRAGAGWRLSVDGSVASGIHYIVAETGRMIVGDYPPIDLHPHMLVILPKGQGFVLEGPHQQVGAGAEKVVHARWPDAKAEIPRFAAGRDEPQLTMVCGYFSAGFGVSLDLFNTLRGPLVEQFDSSNLIQQQLKSALAELVAGRSRDGCDDEVDDEAGASFVASALAGLGPGWDRWFSMFSDPKVVRAFAQMVARPGASHSARSLARMVGLSRSAFMTRFTTTIGNSPMAVLRELRMRHAATLLTVDRLSIEQISRAVGYASRSSFFRAFQKVYGVEPSEVRAIARGRGFGDNIR